MIIEKLSGQWVYGFGGMEWWNGLDWTGLEWTGMEWNDQMICGRDRPLTL